MQSILLIVLYVLIIGYNVSALPSVSINSFYHQSVKRTINVKSHIEEQRVLVKAFNGGVSEEWNYLVAIHPSKASHLSIVKASIDDKELGVDAVKVDDNEGTFFAVRLPSSIAAGSSVSLMITSVFTHTLQALPAEIGQSDSQYVVYGDNLYFYSPYYSDKERSTVKLYSSKIESHTKKSAMVKGNEIEYGPFEKTAAFSFEELSVHYENNSPFVTFSSAVKEVEVSHWGNVAFEESIQLMHTGAKLKGSFSRVDYQKSPTAAPSSYRSISANLPVGATDIYYRDRIGNVSTSHVRQSKYGVFVEVLPRFPMFGGWKSDFQIGYNVPAHYFLFIDKNDSSKYVLNITFATEFEQAAVDEMEVRIVLPEGAYDIDWQTPFDIGSANFDVKVTYLDTTGRPVLVLKKRNVTKFHQQHFQVAYRFGSLSLLHEPFLLVLAFFLFFVASMAYVRLELSIVPSTPTTSLTSRRSGKVGYFINHIINTSLATIIPLVQSKRVSDIDAVIATLNESFEGIQKDPDLADIGKEVKGLLSRLSNDAQRYATNDDGEIRERLAVRMEEIEKVLTALASK